MSEINKDKLYTKEESTTKIGIVDTSDKAPLQNAFTSVLNSFKAKYF